MNDYPVALVVPHAQRYGGAETHVLQLAQSFARRGVRVSVLHRSPGHLDVPGVRFTHCPADEDVERALADDADAVVHVHDQALTAAALRDVRRRRPVIRSWHNNSFACASGTHLLAGRPCPRAHGPLCVAHVATRRCVERPNPVPALRRWRQLGGLLADARDDHATIFYSEYSRTIGARNGLAPERSHVLRYFVERDPERTAVPGDAVVCFAGRLTKVKGVDVLLDAVAQTAAVRRLEIVGDGYERAALERRARTRGLTDRVRFHGWLDEQATKAVMAASDIVAVPSTWPEPFGIVGLEAMSVGRPTVGSSIGGIPEWLSDGETGRLVAPSDAGALARVLDEMLGDGQALARMGAAAWQRVAAFSAEAHVEALTGIYGAALA